jgi:pimeloyl-ACP methyl ester carboxylesterase
MLPILHPLSQSRRRFLGSAAVTMLATHLGLTGSARAQTAKETTMTMTASPRYAAQDATSTDIRPFRVEVSQADLDDLRQRLAATRLPSKELVADRSQGVQLATIQELTRYWATDYNWRKAEARLNALPQFTTEIDGVDIHFIHVRSPHEDALPLIMTHGWPGSVLELLETVGPLTDPTAYGESAEDAFDLVLPSLPGYGFSAEPTELGWESGRIARAWAELMKRLGYDRYVAQGGDVGALVTDVMGRQAPEGLVGIHLNLLAGAPFIVDQLPAESEQERAAHDALATFTKDGFGYFLEQVTRPQTIGYALLDSPVALAAWMLDHDTDSYYKISRAFVDGEPVGNLTRESIVDNITLYWLTGTGASAARWYWETGRAQAAAQAAGQAPPPVSVPVGFTTFPGEIFPAPRSWVETVYPDLAYFNEVDRGGHFAAWEEPELFSAEVRAAFNSLRQ